VAECNVSVGQRDAGGSQLRHAEITVSTKPVTTS
jgi:hypothetical protein